MSKFRLGPRRALILPKVVVAVGGCLSCDQGRQCDRARSSRGERLSSVEKEVHERPGYRKRGVGFWSVTACLCSYGCSCRRGQLDGLTCCRSCSVDGIARLDHVPASTSFLSALKPVPYRRSVERLARSRQRWPQRLAVESAAGSRPVLVRQEATRRACADRIHVW